MIDIRSSHILLHQDISHGLLGFIEQYGANIALVIPNANTNSNDKNVKKSHQI